MQAPDSVEVVMARLMPPAFSEGGQAAIEEMLDELAGSATVVGPAEISSGKWWLRSVMGGGIAASIGALFAIFPSSPKAMGHRELAKQPTQSAPALILTQESDRIESMTDEGWQEDQDGRALRALRLNAVEQNSMLDEESGMEVQISEPREEILLVPVRDF